MMMKFSKENLDGIGVKDRGILSKLSKASKKWSKEASPGKSVI